jgi:tetratricopeptide (TPR) repeat protein
MLAHHYLEALSLADVAGVDAEPLRRPACEALIEAIERSHALNAFSSTARFARAALELGGGDALEEAKLKLRLAQADWYIGQIDLETIDEARDSFLDLDEPELAAEAAIVGADTVAFRGETADALARFDRAAEYLEDRPISLSKARAFAARARERSLQTDPVAFEHAEQALAMAEELGSDELASHALNTRALARMDRGDPGSIEDGERSAELARAAKLPDHLHRALNNLANICWGLGRLDDARRYHDEARVEAERYGNTQAIKWLDGEAVQHLDFAGRWDDALAGSDDVLAEAAEVGFCLEVTVRLTRAQIYLGRGDIDAALAETARALDAGQEGQHSQVLGPALIWRARAIIEAGRTDEADSFVAELLDYDQGAYYMAGVPLLLAAVGRESEYLEGSGRKIPTPWLEAGRKIAERDFRGAAETYDEIGVPALAADARLLAAEALVAEGRRAEADAELQRALAFYRQVRATAYMKRGEALLAASA